MHNRVDMRHGITQTHPTFLSWVKPKLDQSRFFPLKLGRDWMDTHLFDFLFCHAYQEKPPRREERSKRKKLLIGLKEIVK